MTIKLIRTDSDDRAFRSLVKLLDEDLSERDGDEHSFFAQYNKLDKIFHVVVAYQDQIPAGCGAFKEYKAGIAEIKRMYVHPSFRRKGVAGKILTELECWAGELNFTHCILETGIRQPEAINLYHNLHYNYIPNYGQYAGVESSVCMEKSLNS
jgi:GNAT superfamily N-acetyltransferase